MTETNLPQSLNELVSRQEARALMARNNMTGLINLAFHGAFLALGAYLVFAAGESLWRWPAMFFLGVGIVHLFSLQHECAHRTVFKTRWVCDILGSVCGALIMLPNVYFRWEHCEHHTHTQSETNDPQLINTPKTIAGYFYYLTSIPYFWGFATGLVRHISGKLNEQEKRFVPGPEQWKVVWEARILLVIYVVTAYLILFQGVFELLYFWILPRLLAEPFMRFIRMSEHVGRPLNNVMIENTRTTLVNPILRRLAWNMPYHCEHHFAPSVPYHALPALHEHLSQYLVAPARGYWGAHKDILAAVNGSNQNYQFKRGEENAR